MKNQLILLLSSTLCFMGCSTSMTTLEVLQPSQIVLPDHVKSIATIDRSRPEKGFAAVMEGLISGESVGQDKEGRAKALLGLTDALSRTPRFQVRPTMVEIAGSKTGSNMVAPLSWPEIESLCKRYSADAIAAIESFDTNNEVQYSSAQSKQKNKDGTETIRTTFTARRNVRLYVGWRLYDPSMRTVLDETILSEYVEDNASGSTQELAAKNLRDIYLVTRDLAAKVGEKYGMRIAPVWVTVKRNFYNTSKGTGKEPMERANRYTKTGSWDQAAEIWKELTRSGDSKTAGRAAHNLAVAAERLGALPTALDWAKQAYLKYGNKASQSYIQILEQRIADQQRLDYQLKTRT